ncbi:ferric reductase like transmembrane component-domain-containing protein [Hypomontagnella submonticulosa]|nr:ferric reductase like transmembrane component-domain-containing protein [Hypomontagnella submonticulosa]
MTRASLFILATAASLFATALAGTGLIGYGQWWYEPHCSYACRGVIASAPLDCPHDDMADMDMDMDMDMMMASPTAPCIAENVAFLSTLAYCINQTCTAGNLPTWKIEQYWADQATGDPSIPPRWTYGATLANITQAPEKTWESGEVLNYTALLSGSDIEYQDSFNKLFDKIELIQSNYVITIVVVGVGTPLLMSLIGYVPYMTGVLDRLKPYLVYPSTIGTYNIRPLPWMLGNAPTMGQSLYIAMFVILNIILGAVSYEGFGRPHPWGFTPAQEIASIVGYRTGHISMALLPLTVLFSSRNNFLLYLTGWPYSTYIVLHRWVARLCALQAVVHSIALLYAYAPKYYVEVKKPYWIWGIVATLCLVILLFQGLLWFRRKSYEVFLILHILLAVFAIAGCWYHVQYWKPFSGIYENWIYAVCAVWFFDRLVRVLRVARNGICKATVIDISADIVRVDVEGVRWALEPGHHAYAYFPTLNPLRPWENHPFSIIQTAMLHSRKHLIGTSELIQHNSSDAKDIEAGMSKRTEVTTVPKAVDSITMYIKKHSGITKYLRTHASLPVLFDGPYRGNAKEGVLKCDRVLLIGGGIGITGLLMWANAHVNVKLAWSLKETSKSLEEDLAIALDNIADKEVVIGKRLDVNELLAQEVKAGWKRVGVVVCGPDGLCDDVRQAVVTFGRRRETVFELEVDAFSW